MDRNDESKRLCVSIFKNGSDTPSTGACTKAWIKLINKIEKNK